MLGFGSLPETQEEWKELFERMYGVAAPFIGLPGLGGGDDARIEREIAEAYGPITPDVDTAAVLADKQRVMDAKPQSYVPKIIKDKPKEDDDFWSELFLTSLINEMSGGKAGQAPGVVLGGRSGTLPTMMRQFAPRRKPWWIM
jgi:hypothetical protein